MKIIFGLLSLFWLLPNVYAEKKVMVFIALCDNKTQGILPVSPKIGNGDVPEVTVPKIFQKTRSKKPFLRHYSLWWD